MARKYETKEQKDPVVIDRNKLKDMGVRLIEDNLIVAEDGVIRHDSLKLAADIFFYLMEATARKSRKLK